MLIIPTEKRFDWKHAPIILVVLVILNVIIYFAYQFNDSSKYIQAIEQYHNQGFLQKEWPAFEAYLQSKGEQEKLSKYQELFKTINQKTKGGHSSGYDSSDLKLINIVITYDGFYDYLDIHTSDFFKIDFINKWSVPRYQINQIIQSISSLSFGLIPNKISVITLISHQFLHGSIMHLIGNMFFLIICGFAVEAAIGHLRFLFFYLITGVVAGGSFALLDLTSSTPLIGASGAVSGVMAMYLGVFRFKKIEFFYWFFVFVGYLRAPALLILPFFIGKEVYEHFNSTSSNVAFMAHAGGFTAGAILVIITHFINPQSFNSDYIEEDQDIPKKQKELAIVYNNISKFRFSTALNELNKMIKLYGENFEWNLLKFKLLSMQNEKGSNHALYKLITMSNLNEYQLSLIENLWNNSSDNQNQISIDDLYKFGWNMTTTRNHKTAEEIFIRLNNLAIKHPSLAIYARKLSVLFTQLNNNEKQNHYHQIATKLL